MKTLLLIRGLILRAAALLMGVGIFVAAELRPEKFTKEIILLGLIVVWLIFIAGELADIGARR